MVILNKMKLSEPLQKNQELASKRKPERATSAHYGEFIHHTCSLIADPNLSPEQKVSQLEIMTTQSLGSEKNHFKTFPKDWPTNKPGLPPSLRIKFMP